MTFPDENIEQEDNEEPFEDPVKDPKDENVADVPPEFDPNEEEGDGSDDPFDTDDEEEEQFIARSCGQVVYLNRSYLPTAQEL